MESAALLSFALFGLESQRPLRPKHESRVDRCILNLVELPNALQGQPNVERITVVQIGSDPRFEGL